MNDDHDDPGAGVSDPPASARRLAARPPDGEGPRGGLPTIPAPADPDAPPELLRPQRLRLPARDGEHGHVDADGMRGVLREAFTFMSHEPPPRAEGYRLVDVLGRHVSWLDVPADPASGYAVLGAHMRCDLVLAEDTSISSRHVAAIVVRLEDARLGLRVIDLRTDQPPFFDDGTLRRSALARGPFAMRVGRHVVCGFPIAPRGAPNGALPHGADGAHQGATNSPGHTSEEPAPASGRYAVGALLAAPSGLGDPSAAGHFRLTMAHWRSRRWCTGTSAEVPLAELDEGVILGRVRGCLDAGGVCSDAVSRPHLLLLLEHGHLFAFDLASSNGTRVSGDRIRRFCIPERGAAIELGKQLMLVVSRWAADARPRGGA